MKGKIAGNDIADINYQNKKKCYQIAIINFHSNKNTLLAGLYLK